MSELEKTSINTNDNNIINCNKLNKQRLEIVNFENSTLIHFKNHSHFNSESCKRSPIIKIRKKIFFLFTLNITDLLFTWFFLFNHGDIFYEVNIFAKNIIYNIPLSIVLKVFLVSIIVLYWNFRLNTTDNKGIYLSNITANIAVTMYSFINLIHIFNLLILFICK